MGSTLTPMFVALACIIVFTIAHPDSPGTSSQAVLSDAPVLPLAGAGETLCSSCLQQPVDEIIRELSRSSGAINRARVDRRWIFCFLPDNNDAGEWIFCSLPDNNDAGELPKRYLNNERLWATMPTLDLTRTIIKDAVTDLLKDVETGPAKEALIEKMMIGPDAVLKSNRESKPDLSKFSMEKLKEDLPIEDLKQTLTVWLYDVMSDLSPQVITKLDKIVRDIQENGMITPKGLDDSEVKFLRKLNGPNVFTRSQPLLKLLLGAMNCSFNRLLGAGSAALFAVNRPVVGGVLMAGMLWRAFMEAIPTYDALRTNDHDEFCDARDVRVIRNGGIMKSILETGLVPNDIILLQGCQPVPADCRIVFSQDLIVNEGLSTREAKGDGAVVYRGTRVTSGRALAVVFGTGMNTRMGSNLVRHIKKRMTPIIDKDDAWKAIKVSVPVIFGLGAFQMVFGRSPVLQAIEVQCFLMVIALCIAVFSECLHMSSILSLNEGRRSIQGFFRTVTQAFGSVVEHSSPSSTVTLTEPLLDNTPDHN